MSYSVKNITENYNYVKNGIATASLGSVQQVMSKQFENVREANLTNMMENLRNRRQQLVTGVKDGVSTVQSEVQSLARETVQPTVARYTSARDFTYQKVASNCPVVLPYSTCDLFR